MIEPSFPEKKTRKKPPAAHLLMAWQVQYLLGRSSAWLRGQVRKGTIERVSWGGSREGYYHKEQIMQLVREKEAALSHAHTRGDEPPGPAHEESIGYRKDDTKERNSYA